jgi:hypothetical protein
LGAADKEKHRKDFHTIRALVQAPEHGEHAYELVGQLGDAQAGTMKLMRHKRSKEVVAVKFVKLGAGAGILPSRSCRFKS